MSSTKNVWLGDKSDLEDFSYRWKRGRMSALSNVLGRSLTKDEDELMCLLEISKGGDEIKKSAIKAVFHVGGFLASGMTKFFKHSWSPDEIGQLIQASGVACFSSAWINHPDKKAWNLNRPGCSDGQKDHFICEYYKESADGLMAGLGDRYLFSRHSNVHCSESVCIDWIYEFRDSPLKFGPLPADCKALAQECAENLEKKNIQLRVWGLSEGILYYQMSSDMPGFCGGAKKIYELNFEDKIRKIIPNIQFLDMSPRAVIGESQ